MIDDGISLLHLMAERVASLSLPLLVGSSLSLSLGGLCFHYHRSALFALHFSSVLPMASPKSKNWRGARRPPLLRRVMLHSCLCFLLGLFTGLAPSDWTDAANKQVFRALHAVGKSSGYQVHQQHQLVVVQPQLLVVVTTTGLSERERRSAGLTRTAHALRLVSPPVVWLVVEAAGDAADTALLLRRTGVVYRHITYKDNLSSSEVDHQRSVALGHIEQHRLRGVVLFAGLADVYDLRLLEQLRSIRTLGSWPVATVWENQVAVEGPVCSPAAVVTGWFSSGSDPTTTAAAGGVHGFAFSSDLLLDAARWDRFPTSEPDQSQDSIKFVQRLLVEDYNKTMAMPDGNCSEIMVWRVDATLL